MQSNLKNSPRESVVALGSLAALLDDKVKEAAKKRNKQNRKDCNYFDYNKSTKYCYLRYRKGYEKDNAQSSAAPAFCPVGLGT